MSCMSGLHPPRLSLTFPFFPHGAAQMRRSGLLLLELLLTQPEALARVLPSAGVAAPALPSGMPDHDVAVSSLLTALDSQLSSLERINQ